jgi:hypothetical protein
MICLNLLTPLTHSIVQTFICHLFALRAIQLNREASTPKNDHLAVCIWLVTVLANNLSNDHSILVCQTNDYNDSPPCTCIFCHITIVCLLRYHLLVA